MTWRIQEKDKRIVGNYVKDERTFPEISVVTISEVNVGICYAKSQNEESVLVIPKKHAAILARMIYDSVKRPAAPNQEDS